MGLKLITAPTTYLVTRAEAKLHAKVDGTADDSTVDILISAVTGRIEGLLDRKIMQQTWEYVIDHFEEEIVLPIGPVQSITSIKYFDTAGDEQTMDVADYEVDLDSTAVRIVAADSSDWPAVEDGLSKVRIRFVAGYATVPPEIKHACLVALAAGYDDRGGTGNIDKVLRALLFQNQAMSC